MAGLCLGCGVCCVFALCWVSVNKREGGRQRRPGRPRSRAERVGRLCLAGDAAWMGWGSSEWLGVVSAVLCVLCLRFVLGFC
jgi:hypothetical protein